MEKLDDSVLEDWISAFEELPEERQDDLKRWFAMQKIIIEASGLTPEEWFGHVEWALENPLDYSFIQDFPDEEVDLSNAKDETEEDSAAAPRAFVGRDVDKKPLVRGEGVKKMKNGGGLERELFANFMSKHIGRNR